MKKGEIERKDFRQVREEREGKEKGRTGIKMEGERKGNEKGR